MLSAAAPSVPSMSRLSVEEVRRLGYRGPICWPELARSLEGQGRIVLADGETGAVVYPGRWRGRPDGTLRERGWALAEDRVAAWARQAARPYPELIGDAAALVLRTTPRERALAPLAVWLDGVAFAGGQASRRRAERALWAAFRERLAELSGGQK